MAEAPRQCGCMHHSVDATTIQVRTQGVDLRRSFLPGVPTVDLWTLGRQGTALESRRLHVLATLAAVPSNVRAEQAIGIAHTSAYTGKHCVHILSLGRNFH